MAVIQSGASATQWTIDTTSEAGRITFYDTDGNPMSNVSSLSNVLNALNADVTITLGGQSTAGITVTGTSGTLTLSFEATIDGTTWFSVSATPIPVAATVTSTTANGQWVIDLGGFYAFRARISSFTSGSMTVSAVVTPQNSKNISQIVSIAGTLPVSGAVDQGDPNTLTNGWPVKITDGSDVLGTNADPLRVDPTGTTTQPVSISGTIPVSVETVTGNIDTGNSSTTPLSGSATFTGTGIDVSGYAVIGVSALSNRDGTLKLQFSPDNTNWDISVDYSALASNPIRVTTGPQAQYFRVVYVNSGSAQAFFRLQTIEKSIANYPSTVPVDTVIDVDDDAIITKSVITGKTTGGGGGYVDVKVNPSGTLVVDASGTTVPVSGTVTANQGTAASLSGYWPVQVTDGTNTMPTGDVAARALFNKITDGTNGPAAVKAASTAPIATDPSLVVTISPNSPAPATNTGVVSSVNSSTATLGIGAVFTGTGESSLNYESVSISVMAIGASAPPGTLSVQQSSDGTNWDIQDSFSVAGGTASPTGSFDIIVPLAASNFRIVYTNGAVAQTSFRLQAVKWPIKVSLPNATQKGIQPQVFTATQDCKDSGRVIRTFVATSTATSTTEAMVTLTPLTDFVAAATGTSFTVTAGKRFRIQTFSAVVKGAGAIQTGSVRLRISSSGAVTTATAVAAAVATTPTTATAGSAAGGNLSFPDGLELTGTMQFGISQQYSVATGLLDVQLIGYEY